MTPAVIYLEKRKVAFKTLEYEHHVKQQNYAIDAANKLEIDPHLLFKTLIAEIDDGRFAVAIVPAHKQLSMKKLAKIVGGKKAAMAEEQKVQSMTGYVLGGVSPFGQKRNLPTVLDMSAEHYQTIYVSGGRRGLEIAIAPSTLASLLNAKIANISA